MAAFSITVPTITCSFPCAIHPDARHLLEVTDAWFVDRCKPIVAAWPDSKLAARLYAADHLVSSAVGLIPVLFYANAVSKQRVLPILKLVSCYFMIDNCVDEPGMLGTDPAKCAHIINSVMAVFVPTNVCKLSRPSLLQVSSDESTELVNQDLARIFTRTASEWWAEMCIDMPLSQQARFCELFKLYLSNIIKETHTRSTGAPPDVQTCFTIRSHTLGWYPLDVLTEYTLGMELGQDALANPLVKALKKCVCEAILLVNDMVSFPKEFESGDYLNVVMALCSQRLIKKKGLSPSHAAVQTSAQVQSSTPTDVGWLATPDLLQECMNEAGKMVEERGEQCVCLIEKLKGNAELMQKPGMAAYLEALGNHIAGNIYWHFASGRYNDRPSKEEYKPSPEKIKECMVHALASRTLLVKSDLIYFTSLDHKG